jgi:hypothetical protein
VQQVVVVSPIYTYDTKAYHIADQLRNKRFMASQLVPWGGLSSSTIMVIIMAITPSLKASNLVLFIEYFSIHWCESFPGLSHLRPASPFKHTKWFWMGNNLFSQPRMTDIYFAYLTKKF